MADICKINEGVYSKGNPQAVQFPSDPIDRLPRNTQRMQMLQEFSFTILPCASHDCLPAQMDYKIVQHCIPSPVKQQLLYGAIVMLSYV